MTLLCYSRHGAGNSGRREKVVDEHQRQQAISVNDHRWRHPYNN